MASDSVASEWSTQHGGNVQRVAEESLLLTGDEYLVDANLTVQYHVRDPALYLFHAVAAEETLRQAAEAALRRAAERTSLESLLTTGRAPLERQIAAGAQAACDRFETGLEVASARLQEVHPPARWWRPIAMFPVPPKRRRPRSTWPRRIATRRSRCARAGGAERRHRPRLHIRPHPPRPRRRRSFHADGGRVPTRAGGQLRAPLPGDGRAGAGRTDEVRDGPGRRRPAADVARGRPALRTPGPPRAGARAYEQAEKIKGEGDAQSMRIYAGAYNRDPQFYKLTRTLDAYRKFMNDKTTVVLSSDSELMKLLTSGKLDQRGK